MKESETKEKRSYNQVHVYSAERRSHPVQIFRSILRDFRAAHSLGFRFAERNIRSTYRQSIFGLLWAFLPPLGTALIWIILNRSNVVNIKDVNVPYPLFVLTGTMLWSVFVNSVLMPMKTMQSNKAILTKINFPREAMLVDAFYEILFNAGIVIIIIIIELFIYRFDVTWACLYFIPCIFMIILLGISIGLLLLPLSLLYKDVQFVLPSVLQFAMYLSPVVYAKPIYSGATKILAYNPISPILTSARSWLLNMHQATSLSHLSIILAATLFMLMVGLLMQRITIEILIERMGT